MNRVLSCIALLSLVSGLAAGRPGAAAARTISAPMALAPGDSLHGAPRDSANANGRRRVTFTPGRLDQCDYFFVTETGLSQINLQVYDWMDNHIIRNSFGLMKNVSASRAAGVSLDAQWLQGVVTVSPSVRVRQWIGRRQSVELAATYMANNQHGLDGPMAGVRYSPHPALFVEGGICRVKSDWYRYGYNGGVLQYGYVEDHTWQGYGGIGLAAAPGVTIWGAELVALGVLGVMLAGMD